MCPKHRNCEFCAHYFKMLDNTYVCLAYEDDEESFWRCDDMFQCIETDCNLDCISE